MEIEREPVAEVHGGRGANAFAQESPQRQPSDAAIKAKMDKRKAMLWYVVEPMGVPCASRWVRIST